MDHIISKPPLILGPAVFCSPTQPLYKTNPRMSCPKDQEIPLSTRRALFIQPQLQFSSVVYSLMYTEAY